MKMKLRIIITILTISFIQYACNKDFLDKTDPTKIDVNKFYRNQEEVEQAVNGVYGQLQGIINNQWTFNEMTSDNTTFHFSPDNRGQADKLEAFEFYTVNQGSVNIADMYNAYYNAIYNINTTLAKLEAATIPDSLKPLYQGQLAFFRAYYYFNLTQYFGDVIVITEPVPQDQTSKAWEYVREPQEKVYTQIEKDLTDAVTALPVKYSSTNKGRATKGAALGLLGKVYLTQKKYADAVGTLQQILPLGYTLVPNYSDVFDPAKKNGPESIFEVQYQGENDLGEWSSFIYTFAPRLSAGAVTGFPKSNPGGWNTPTKDMIAAYEENDKRKDVSLKEGYTNAQGVFVAVPYINKYNHRHTIEGRTNDNWPILRYADVLLMLAEALNEQSGPSSDAYNNLNQVRQRAGLEPLNGLNKETFRTAVLQERRVELAFENHRWFDLKRTKTPQELAAFLNAYTAREKANPTVSRGGIPYSNTDYVFSPHEALFPIPSQERLTNSKLTQNEGY